VEKINARIRNTYQPHLILREESTESLGIRHALEVQMQVTRVKTGWTRKIEEWK
jgi:hypothetical protein